MDKERLEIAAVNVHETSGLVTSGIHTEDTSNYFEDFVYLCFFAREVFHLLLLSFSGSFIRQTGDRLHKANKREQRRV